MNRKSFVLTLSLTLLVLAPSFTVFSSETAPSSKIQFTARYRAETQPNSGLWQVLAQETYWKSSETMVIVCDMWDQHWCNNATKREGEMIPRVNELIDTLRGEGVLIVHAPSGTMDAYKDRPERKRAQNAPKANPPVPIPGWNHLDPDYEGQLPIDDSDEGCDDSPQSKSRTAWKAQHPDIHIAPEDAISDSGQEIYNLIAARGIKNVLMLGVHLNMCVLGRPFGIRQMNRMELNIVLIRDLTDTMYNPAMPPHVSHYQGTQLMIGHVEKFWAPSVLSEDLLEELR